MKNLLIQFHLGLRTRSGPFLRSIYASSRLGLEEARNVASRSLIPELGPAAHWATFVFAREGDLLLFMSSRSYAAYPAFSLRKRASICLLPLIFNTRFERHRRRQAHALVL
uniref:Uncharacterized protein n=1 Tax=Strombidium inclinatum TaxID=197538 RepID=A0A7S3N5C8_9SPIT